MWREIVATDKAVRHLANAKFVGNSPNSEEQVSPYGERILSHGEQNIPGG